MCIYTYIHRTRAGSTWTRTWSHRPAPCHGPVRNPCADVSHKVTDKDDFVQGSFRNEVGKQLYTKVASEVTR